MARFRESYTDPYISFVIRTAPAGIRPPLNAFARITMSGSTP